MLNLLQPSLRAATVKDGIPEFFEKNEWQKIYA